MAEKGFNNPVQTLKNAAVTNLLKCTQTLKKVRRKTYKSAWKFYKTHSNLTKRL